MVRKKLLLAIFLPFLLLLHSNHILVSISATKFDLDRPSSVQSSASSTFLRERLQRLANGDPFSSSPFSTHSLLENRQEDQEEQLVNRRRLHTCQHHCSISDPKALPCWNETLHFYEEIIVGLLRRTIRVETNRAIWMLANQPPIASPAHIDFGRLADDSRRRLKQLPLGQRVHDDNDWKTAKPVLDSLSTALAQNAQSVMGKLTRDHYGSQFPQLETECPHGCERAWDSWKWLFVGSLLVSMLLLGLLFLLVFLLDKRAQSAWNEEAEEFGGTTANGSLGMGMGKKSSVVAQQQQQQQDQMLRTFRVVR